MVYRSPKLLETPIKLNSSDIETNLNNISKIITEYTHTHSNNSETTLYNNQKNYRPPFGTSNERVSYFTSNSLKTIFNPGPGTYNVSKTLIKKSFSKNETSPAKILENSEDSENLFINKSKRFSYPKKTKSISPIADYNKEEYKKYIDSIFSKKTTLYKNDTFTFEPFNPKRILSILPKGMKYVYKENGSLEVLSSDYVDDDNYSINLKSKKTKKLIKNYNSITKKSKGKLNEYIEKEKEKNLLNNSNINDNPKLESNNVVFNSNSSTNEPTINSSVSVVNFNKSNISKNYFNTNLPNREDVEIKLSNTKIYKNNTNLVGDSTEEGILNKLYKDKNRKNFDSPGPGEYELPDKNIISPKSPKFQNFGSTVSRGIMYPSIKNFILIGKKNKDNLTHCVKNNISGFKNSINTFKEKYNFNKTKLFKKKNSINSFNTLSKLNMESIKQKNILAKIEQKSKIGPGSYEPLYNEKKLSLSSDIENFGSLEKRFPNYSTLETPGAGSYLQLQTWGDKKEKKTNYFHNIKKPEKNLEEQKEICKNVLKQYKINPEIGQYEPDRTCTIDYENYKTVEKSKTKPCFGSNLKRFNSLSKNKINDNFVGKYELLIPEKKNYQQKSPFLVGAERDTIENMGLKFRNNSEIGPGSYLADSYFQWNKKSFNMLFT